MLRSSLLAALATVFGCAAVLAAATLFAELAMARPRAAMAQWQAGASIGTHAARQALLDRIHMAIAVAPSAADSYLQLGRLYAWHASLHPRGSARHGVFARRARAAFAAARARRPTWGFAWAREAEQMTQLGYSSAAVWPMIEKAMRLAPGEPETLLKSLWVALRWWDDLDAASRERLRVAYARLHAAPAYRARAARIATHYARTGIRDGRVGATAQ